MLKRSICRQVYNKRASWLTPRKSMKNQVFRVFKKFFKGQIWHSQVEELWCFYVLIMKSVPSQCPLPPRFTIWHLQTCKLNWQSQREMNRSHAIGKRGSWSILLCQYLEQCLDTGSFQWTLRLNEWMNQSTNQPTNSKYIAMLWKSEAFHTRIMLIHFSLSLRNWKFFSHWINHNRSKYSSKQRKLRLINWSF